MIRNSMPPDAADEILEELDAIQRAAGQGALVAAPWSVRVP